MTYTEIQAAVNEALEIQLGPQVRALEYAVGVVGRLADRNDETLAIAREFGLLPGEPPPKPRKPSVRKNAMDNRTPTAKTINPLDRVQRDGSAGRPGAGPVQPSLPTAMLRIDSPEVRAGLAAMNPEQRKSFYESVGQYRDKHPTWQELMRWAADIGRRSANVRVQNLPKGTMTDIFGRQVYGPIRMM